MNGFFFWSKPSASVHVPAQFFNLGSYDAAAHSIP